MQVSFRYDPLGRRISKTRSQTLNGQPQGRRVTTRFVWERFRLLQEIQDEVPLTYVYSDEGSYDPLARIDGSENPEIYWFHNQPNGTPERLTDAEGQLRWEGQNSAWGKLLRESSLQGPGFAQNLRMQGQYLDRETGLHYNLFRYYDPDCGRFTQPDPIGLLGGLNLYQYAPNALGWVDPWGLSPCKGLPSTRKAGGTGKNYDPVNGQGLYVLHDGKNILYVGRGDAPSRLTIHSDTPGKSHLRQLTVFDNNLTKSEAKFLEQRIMDLHGGAQSTNPVTNLLNKIRSYSPTNPNARTYDIAGHSKQWGVKILNDTLSILGGKGL